MSQMAFRRFARECTIEEDGDDSQGLVVLHLGIEAVDERGTLMMDVDTADFFSQAPPVGAILRDIAGYTGRMWEVGRRISDDGFIVKVLVQRYTPPEEP